MLTEKRPARRVRAKLTPYASWVSSAPRRDWDLLCQYCQTYLWQGQQRKASQNTKICSMRLEGGGPRGILATIYRMERPRSEIMWCNHHNSLHHHQGDENNPSLMPAVSQQPKFLQYHITNNILAVKSQNKHQHQWHDFMSLGPKS